MQLLDVNEIEQEQVIIEDGFYHARLSIREYIPKGESEPTSLIVKHEILDTPSARDTGEPVDTVVYLESWIDLGNPKLKWMFQTLAKAIGHTEEKGPLTSEHLENQVVKVKVEYNPEGVSKAGKPYPASNRIKTWYPKDETFEDVVY